MTDPRKLRDRGGEAGRGRAGEAWRGRAGEAWRERAGEAWTSCVPKRGKTGLEVLGDIKPKGEEDAKEKLEIIPVTDILMSGISLEKGKLSASCSLQLKRKLFALRYQSVILII